jgi:preprotein translocase subunit SecF
MISFVRYRVLAAAFSLSIITVFAGLCIYRMQTRGYVFTYSVDFTGGTQVLLKFDKAMRGSILKDILAKAGFEGVMTRDFSEQEVLVRVKDFSNDAKGLAERMRQAIVQAAPDNQVSVLQSEGVGPGIGEELRWKSVRAVLFSLLALLIYIAIRFWSFGFALGAVVALFHDALIMLAIFLFLGREISINVIAAILAVLGYSINDTIVIFSQIRKNLKGMHQASLNEIVDISLNQTLRRTLLTSITTGLAVISMFVLGGEALRDFSLALLTGIVFGTYSSVYIASPVMMLINRKK